MNRAPDRGGGASPPAALVVIVAAGLAAAVLGGCAAPTPRFGDPRLSQLPLDAWVTMMQAADGTVRPCVRVSAPYQSLVFRRDGDRYASGLEVQVIAWRDGVQAGGGVGSGGASVVEAAATRSGTLLEVAAPLLVRGDEPVLLDVVVRVTETSRVWARQLSFAPRALAAMPLWIEALGTNLEVDPAGERRVPAGADSLHLDVRLRRQPRVRDWPSAGLALVSEVSGPALDQPRRLQTPVPRQDADTLTVTQLWPVDRLPFGRCRLQIGLESGRDEDRLRLPREPALTFISLHVPFHDERAWKRHLLWLEGLVETATLDSLRDVPESARSAGWRAIWNRLGTGEPGGPAAAERRHVARIVAADDRFGGFGRGAATDRGRGGSRGGEPARVETFADAHTPGASWEGWGYPDFGRRFVFYAAHGRGDFRLQAEEPVLE